MGWGVNPSKDVFTGEPPPGALAPPGVRCRIFRLACSTYLRRGRRAVSLNGMGGLSDGAAPMC